MNLILEQKESEESEAEELLEKPLFGLLKRNGNVYGQVVENCFKASLMPIIQGKILEGSAVY